MQRRPSAVVFGVTLVATLGALGVPVASRQAATRAGSPAPARPDAFETSIKPFLQTYCYSCDSGGQPAAGFDLTAYATSDAVVSDERRWNLVVARLKAGEMPPS